MPANAKVASVNRKAYHDYHIEETMEAGIVLTGTEIKSIRTGKVSLRDSYAKPDNGEVWLLNSHIAHYEAGNLYNHEPGRPRKLLLNRSEIRYLMSETMQKGYTLVPLRIYFKRGLAKLELGLGKGKKLYDKRQTIARRDVEREVSRDLKAVR
jgi:SsrA-binding protein